MNSVNLALEYISPCYEGTDISQLAKAVLDAEKVIRTIVKDDYECSKEKEWLKEHVSDK